MLVDDCRPASFYRFFGEETRYDLPAMSDEFPVFEIVLNKRGRAWKWQVRTTAGNIVMWGSELSRPAAMYNAYRAFFLLLQSAPNIST